MFINLYVFDLNSRCTFYIAISIFLYMFCLFIGVWQGGGGTGRDGTRGTGTGTPHGMAEAQATVPKMAATAGAQQREAFMMMPVRACLKPYGATESRARVPSTGTTMENPTGAAPASA